MRHLLFTASVAALLTAPAVQAASEDLQAIQSEIRAMRDAYESRIAELEKRLETVQKDHQVQASKQANSLAAIEPAAGGAATPASGERRVRDNSFNPSIGVILNGKYSNFSQDSADIAGFQVGEEGERSREGFAVDESELNFSANVDDKFAGSLTAAIVREEGEDKIELEEAYVKALPGLMPQGVNAAVGRKFWTLGYLNEHHAHADDFADRPLPYRAFLNNAFNDDGVEVSYVLPTEFYSEIGGGLFRGDDFPSGSGEGGGVGAYTGFARVGGELGDDHSWRLGAYTLQGSTGTAGRVTGESGEEVTFVGDSDLYAVDFKHAWTPTGNRKEQEVLLQGEYFWRSEDGTYADAGNAIAATAFDDTSSGWYAQSVYKFAPAWRVGARYTALDAADIPAGLAGSAIDADGHDPEIYSVMADWTNSEFGRWRVQYNHDDVAADQTDHQFILQYVMSLGAHGAHPY